MLLCLLFASKVKHSHTLQLQSRFHLTSSQKHVVYGDLGFKIYPYVLHPRGRQVDDPRRAH